MTYDKKFKQRVRERMRKTGESFAAAVQSLQALSTEPIESLVDKHVLDLSDPAEFDRFKAMVDEMHPHLREERAEYQIITGIYDEVAAAHPNATPSELRSIVIARLPPALRKQADAPVDDRFDVDGDLGWCFWERLHEPTFNVAVFESLRHVYKGHEAVANPEEIGALTFRRGEWPDREDLFEELLKRIPTTLAACDEWAAMWERSAVTTANEAVTYEDELEASEQRLRERFSGNESRRQRNKRKRDRKRRKKKSQEQRRSDDARSKKALDALDEALFNPDLSREEKDDRWRRYIENCHATLEDEADLELLRSEDAPQGAMQFALLLSRLALDFKDAGGKRYSGTEAAVDLCAEIAECTPDQWVSEVEPWLLERELIEKHEPPDQLPVYLPGSALLRLLTKFATEPQARFAAAEELKRRESPLQRESRRRWQATRAADTE